MELPQININGTARSDLLEDYLLAKQALERAADSLCACSPHGRDYQTLPPGTFYRAQQEHVERIAKVRSIAAEIETIAYHVVQS